jgi:hypothetical protein
MAREFEAKGGLIVTPSMRLQDAAYTRIILATLPEVTPVSQAAALQDDLRRAGIEPYAWVLNKSVLAAGTHDPLLAARLSGERRQIERMSAGSARRMFTLAWLVRPPIGIAELSGWVAGSDAKSCAASARLAAPSLLAPRLRRRAKARAASSTAGCPPSPALQAKSRCGLSACFRRDAWAARAFRRCPCPPASRPRRQAP